MMKTIKQFFMGTLVIIDAVIGLTVTTQQVSAKSRYLKAVPTALRGSWVSAKAQDHYTNKFVLTKYTLTQYYYRYGKNLGGAWKISMKSKNRNNRLGVLSKSKQGYYRLGQAHGEMPMTLKRTKYHGKAALVTYNINPVTHKIKHTYLLKK